MTLTYISRDVLVKLADGDPWKVNATLQSGQPAQIADLGQAFHNAGQSTQQADQAFTDARRRVDAWIRDNGQHPITDSTVVQRTAAALGLQAAQLPKIAVDLENVAGALAQAQVTANGYIAALDARLQTLDDWIGQADDLITQDEDLLAEADDEDDICELEDDIDRLQQYINDCEREAIDDTKVTLQQVEKVRQGYVDELNKAKANLSTDGYDPAALEQVDGEEPKNPSGNIPPSGLEAGELADLRHVTNQAVVDQMAKVRAAQKAIDDAAAAASKGGAGSPEMEAALARLPELKKNLADALNDLGKLPDYNDIDPTTMRSGADGHFLFGYTADGQPVQVTGQLKNGTGEIFDQGEGTYYTFKDGKLVGMRTPDPGRVEATDEPLLSAVTLAVGAPELKAGGEAAVQGFKALLERRAIGLGADITSENVLPQTFAAAESRAEAAAHNLATEHVPASVPPGAAIDHPPPVATAEHPPPATTTHEPALPGNGTHVPAPPPGLVEHPLPADHPIFEGYHPIDPGPEFTKADGSLLYPDDTLASKPYAIPGTIVPDAHLAPGTVIDRFGYSQGSYLSPEGVPFAERALPPDSALKPYCQYVVDDPAKLPPGYHIEQSRAASWFHQPGGGLQYRIIGPDGKDAPVDALLDSGYLKEAGK